MISKPRKVLLHVQHLFGVGHVYRAKQIADKFVERGFNLTIAFGGMPLPEVDFGPAQVEYLPPLRATSTAYSEIVTADGQAATSEYLGSRSKLLLDLYSRTQPDILITEAYPFGRRILRHEMLPLLEAAKRASKAPLIFCSVRDILQENRKPGRSEEAVDIVNRYFDWILVHADPRIIRFEQTFPLVNQIKAKIHYTGIVARLSKGDSAGPHYDIVASAGGGAFGQKLIGTVVDVAGNSSLSDHTWLVLAGRNASAEHLAKLRQRSGRQIHIEPFIADFPDRLRGAQLSISQAGYNTVADVLAAGCAALFVPSDTGGQTEQVRRASLLAKAGLAHCLPESLLSPKSLEDRIRIALASSPSLADIAMDGAEQTVDFVQQALGGGITDQPRDSRLQTV